MALLTLFSNETSAKKNPNGYFFSIYIKKYY